MSSSSRKYKQPTTWSPMFRLLTSHFRNALLILKYCWHNCSWILRLFWAISSKRIQHALTDRMQQYFSLYLFLLFCSLWALAKKSDHILANHSVLGLFDTQRHVFDFYLFIVTRLQIKCLCVIGKISAPWKNEVLIIQSVIINDEMLLNRVSCQTLIPAHCSEHCT